MRHIFFLHFSLPLHRFVGQAMCVVLELCVCIERCTHATVCKKNYVRDLCCVEEYETCVYSYNVINTER